MYIHTLPLHIAALSVLLAQVAAQVFTPDGQRVIPPTAVDQSQDQDQGSSVSGGNDQGGANGDGNGNAHGKAVPIGTSKCGWEVMEDGDTSMSALGSLYASQTGDTSQCTVVDGRNSTSSSSRVNGDTTTSPDDDKDSTFCACVFETCGNGVWRRTGDSDSESASVRPSGLMSDSGSASASTGSWDWVKPCEKYCHAGACV